MKTYEILSKNTAGYQTVIYATSYNNPTEDLNDISRDIRKQAEPGRVLFDLLLANGDEFNRFAEGYFDGQNISYSSLKTVEITNPAALKHINSFYTQNRQILNNGVLSSSEKFKFARG